MEITLEIVKKVAENSRLKLKEEEIKKFAEDLKEVLTAFTKLSEVDTKDVKPSFHPTPVFNVSREDEPGKCEKREDALKLTQHSTNEYFKGPKTI